MFLKHAQSAHNMVSRVELIEQMRAHTTKKSIAHIARITGYDASLIENCLETGYGLSDSAIISINRAFPPIPRQPLQSSSPKTGDRGATALRRDTDLPADKRSPIEQRYDEMADQAQVTNLMAAKETRRAHLAGLDSAREEQRSASENIKAQMRMAEPRALYAMLHQNTGLTYSEIGKNFSPEISGTIINATLAGKRKLDAEFVEKFAKAIKSELDKGVDEGWLDSARKLPREFEDILLDKLGTNAVGDKKGLAALMHSIGYAKIAAGLPDAVIGPMLGEERTWYTDKKTNQHGSQFYASDVVRIADAIKPYIEGTKLWNGTLEITNPLWAEYHKKARDYLIERIKAPLPKAAENEIDEILEPVSTHPGEKPDGIKDTLGPTIRALREAIKFSQTEPEWNVQQSTLNLLERNCFSPYLMEPDGIHIKPAFEKGLNNIARVIGKNWCTRRERTAPPKVGEKYFTDEICTRSLSVHLGNMQHTGKDSTIQSYTQEIAGDPSRPSVPTIRRQLGSWENAMRLAREELEKSCAQNAETR